MNWELPDIPAGFRKGRRTRGQIANIHWTIEKAREFQKNFSFIGHAKAFDCVDHSKLWKILKEMGILDHLTCLLGFPGGSEVKASACNVGDLGLIPGSGRSLGEWNGNPLQYSCLENPLDGGAWWAIVHGVTKSQTQLSDFTSHQQPWNLVVFLTFHCSYLCTWLFMPCP